VADESDFQLQNSLQSIEFGKECVRSGFLINGGAAVAVIGLLGGSKSISDMGAIQSSLTAFCVGVIFSFLAAMLGYAAQMQFAVVNNRVANGQLGVSSRIPLALSILGAILVIGSLLEFCYGIFRAGGALFPVS
jgi:hypothetical protein